MSCLDHILHAVTGTGRPVLLRVSTLRERSSGPLRTLRPDLDLRGQIKAWASLQGLVTTWSADEHWVTFHPVVEARPGEEETGRGGDNQP